MTSKLSHECRGDNDLSGFHLDMHVTMKASVFSFYKGENKRHSLRQLPDRPSHANPCF